MEDVVVHLGLIRQEARAASVYSLYATVDQTQFPRCVWRFQPEVVGIIVGKPEFLALSESERVVPAIFESGSREYGDGLRFRRGRSSATG
jgi:hypothetical protein